MQDQVVLKGIASESRLTNGELAQRFPEWPAARILEKTGIRERRADEFASDLALGAAKKLFD